MESEMKMRSLVFYFLCAIAGLAWRAPIWWMGPLAGLVLPIGVPALRNGRSRFIAAALYFGAGSFGLVPGAGVFFGHGPTSYILGTGLWIGSAALLAAPWLIADSKKPWTIITALALDIIPPIGLFGWLSPISAAGVLFPGSGLFGIIILMVSIIAFHILYKSHSIEGLIKVGAPAALIIILGGGLITHQLDKNKTGVPDFLFSAVNTNLGLVPENPIAVINRNKQAIRVAQRDHAFIVVLPETVADWLPGTAEQYQDAVPRGQRWLIGATTHSADGLLSDSVIEIGRGGLDKIIGQAAFPVPVSMWHPWEKGGYAATWREPIVKIDGFKTAIVICYDQIISWPWLEAEAGRPDAIIAPRNDWWAIGTGIPKIQLNTDKAMSRLTGARLIVSTNW